MTNLICIAIAIVFFGGSLWWVIWDVRRGDREMDQVFKYLNEAERLKLQTELILLEQEKKDMPIKAIDEAWEKNRT